MTTTLATRAASRLEPRTSLRMMEIDPALAMSAQGGMAHGGGVAITHDSDPLGDLAAAASAVKSALRRLGRLLVR